jgi:hypothetical protein
VGGGRRHGAEPLAPVDPPTRLRARRDRAGPGQVLAGLADRRRQHQPVAGDLLERRRKRARTTLHALRDRGAVAALHVEHRHQVHVHADRDRRVAARQPARGDHQVVRGRHAQAAEVDRHGRREVPRGLERVDRLERVAAVAVVLGRPRGQLGRERLGDRDEPRAGFGVGGELDHPAVASSATGTPLVTMS